MSPRGPAFSGESIAQLQPEYRDIGVRTLKARPARLAVLDLHQKHPGRRAAVLPPLAEIQAVVVRVEPALAHCRTAIIWGVERGTGLRGLRYAWRQQHGRSHGNRQPESQDRL